MRAFTTWLSQQGLSEALIQAVVVAVAALVFALLVFISKRAAQYWLVPLAEKYVRRTSNHWDDILAERGFFRRLSSLLPVVIIYFAADIMFPPPSLAGEFLRRLILALFVVISVRVLDALLRAIQNIYAAHEVSRGKSIRGYIQAAGIIIYITGGIFIISIVTDKSPWGLLTLFGGLTAVIILVFKDTILGFIASIQLSALDMVRVGDWIEMPKYGADGDVIDVSIHTVKVRNWDKTVTTIPTYALVSDTFRNWRGMQESGGRRIKRSVYIDMNSITFCTEEMLAGLERIALLKDYLAAKKQEIAEYNASHRVDTAHPVNGRRQTNIGVFRAYVVAYLRNHPQIHQDMTFLVRHLQPTAQGLPLEIYVFSKDQVWANYEAIQADIFDHVLAAAPEFGLRIFQYPSGHDLHACLGGGRAFAATPQ